MVAISTTGSAPAAACAHCGLPVACAGDPLRCRGSGAVSGLLHREDLTRYYELQGGNGCPVPGFRDEHADRKWLEPVLARVAASGSVQRLRLDVQGLHCSACVWLLEQLFARHAGGLRLDIN